MAQQQINNGDSGLVARVKINDNFDRLNGTVNGRLYVGFDAGAFETGNDKLYITSLTAAQQVDEATGRTKALIYGINDTDTANQILVFNASVGIGTSTPDSKLDIEGTLTLSNAGNSATAPSIKLLDDAFSTRAGISFSTSSAPDTMFLGYTGLLILDAYAGSGTEDAQFTSTGAFTRITSDENTKNIVGDLDAGLDYVLAAAKHTIEYRYINPELNADGHMYWGFGARGVTDEYGSSPAFRLYKKVYGWDTKQMIAPAYNAIAELNNTIISLEKRISILEN